VCVLRRPALAQDGREFTRTTQQRSMWTSNMHEGIEDGASVEWMRGPDVGGPNKPFLIDGETLGVWRPHGGGDGGGSSNGMRGK
jgi:hypothetical protein